MIDQFNKRSPLRWVSTVYFAMGLPYVALSLVSVLILTDMKIDDKTIAFWTSLLVLPWSLKPFFSLVMELIGTKKQYLIITEIASAIMFGLIVFALPLPNFFTYTLALMGVIALSGSMHDIAGDGIYLDALDKSQQSKFIGWQGAFYNLAKILTNGGLVFLAGWLSHKMGLVNSWRAIMAICCGIMLLVALYHMRVLPKGKVPEKNDSFSDKMHGLWEVIKTFFLKKYIWIYLLFIIVYRFAEGLAMKIAPIFLKKPITDGGLGLSNEQYGLVYGTFGTVAFIAGSILAGYYISHFGLRKVLVSLACIFNIPFVVYLLFALFQPSNIAYIATGIVFEYFSYGFGFVGLMLFMMQQVAPGKFQMAHYAFATSIMNLSVMLPGMISGYLSDTYGYKTFFIIVMFATIPAIIMSWLVPFTYPDPKKS